MATLVMSFRIEWISRGVILCDFFESREITSRLMHSMRSDITRVAMAATEPETVQNSVFFRVSYHTKPVL